MANAQNFQGTSGVNKSLGTSGNYSAMGQILASSAVQGITAMMAQSAQNTALASQATQYLAQKSTAAFNEQLAKQATAQAYSSGAYQAMMQGLKDAQIIAQTRASRAGSGVKLGVGSAKEIEASQRISAAMNQAQIQKSTIEQATNHILEQANYQAQQVIAQGNADASNALQQSSGLAGLSSFINAAAMFNGLWQSGGNNTSPLFGWMDGLFSSKG